MLDVVWDMETGDPDDFLTLLLLLGHPQVNLKAVTVTPGSPQQIGLVRQALKWFERDLPVGAANLDHTKPCVSPWHYDAYGKIPPSREAEPGADVLLRCCDAQTTLLTGGPLRNLGKAISLALADGRHEFVLGRLVAQGGFAGEGVVPPELQLERFRGLSAFPSYNLNGDHKAALAALSYAGIGVRRFVSKNVCHKVAYDRAMHAQLAEVKARSRALALIWQGMECYLNNGHTEKKLHDPLAACCAIDETIGIWAEVELARSKTGEWGSHLSPGSGTWIIIDYRHARFMDMLLAY